MKKKLKIQELKIQSFVTELDASTAKTAKGGSDTVGVCGASVIITAITAVSGAVSTAYSVISKAKSWWPYDNSTECTKITTTTTTTAAP